MLSNQQQHTEMYEINRKCLEINQSFEEIQKEIDNTHEFLEVIEANRLATMANHLAATANRLANWGIPLAVGGLATALFSMSDRNIWQCLFETPGCSIDSDLLAQVTVVSIVIVGVIIVLRERKK